MKVRICSLILAFIVLSGCGSRPEPIRIGAKQITEQRILSELIGLLLESEGYEVEADSTFADTFTAQRMLVTGEVDLMIEYSGTRWLFENGAMPDDPENLLKDLRAKDERVGLSWSVPLGFENGYCLIIDPRDAENHLLASISDLAKLNRPVRVACIREFLRRPVDGFEALTTHYAFRRTPQVQVVADLEEGIQALLDHEVDVLVGFETDGAIDRLSLQVLEDDKNFWPPYEAVVVVRSSLLEDDPGLEEVLERLRGRLDARTMQVLNGEVSAGNRPPRAVAREWLREVELIPIDSGLPSRQVTQIVLVQSESREFGLLIEEARRAIRRVFPDRAFVFDSVEDPFQAIATGKARLALLDAKQFFQRDSSSGELAKREGLIALAVVGNEALHVFRRVGDEPTNPFEGQLGLVQLPSASFRDLQELLGRPDSQTIGPLEDLIKQLREGQLDAVITLRVPGGPEILEILEAKADPVQLVPVIGWMTVDRSKRFPYFRPVRIEPEKTGAEQAIATLGMQVVLAGSAEMNPELSAGPVSALPSGGLPLTPAQAAALADAVRVDTAPDPSLPSNLGVSSELESQTREPLAQQVWITLANLLAIVFLIWLVSTVFNPISDTEAKNTGITFESKKQVEKDRG